MKRYRYMKPILFLPRMLTPLEKLLLKRDLEQTIEIARRTGLTTIEPAKVVNRDP